MPGARITVLDGPMGSALEARGVDVSGRGWSARALDTAESKIYLLHREYASAGASVHTANTFRTQRTAIGADWFRLAQKAVALARGAVPQGHRVAGSLAPIADCYRPDLSPPETYDAHLELADALVDAGCDLLLCETFPNPREALEATRAAASTGAPTWTALTPGPEGTLLTPQALAHAAAACAAAGAKAVLVNCAAAQLTLPYVQALAEALGDAIPFGAYANAGGVQDGLGWLAEPTTARPAPSLAPNEAAHRYAELARSWVDAGATIVGSCCGTTPAHIKALAALARAAQP